MGFGGIGNWDGILVSGHFSARGLESICANYCHLSTLEGKQRRIRLLLSSHSDTEVAGIGVLRNWNRGYDCPGFRVSFIRVSVKRDELGFFLNPLCHQSSQW